jgi:hypothetical protein
VGMISPCRRNAPGSNVCRCPSSVFMARRFAEASRTNGCPPGSITRVWGTRLIGG